MKASFMILPVLLMSAAAQKRGGGGNQQKVAGSAQAPAPPAPKRSWFGWVQTWRPAPKKPDNAG